MPDFNVEKILLIYLLLINLITFLLYGIDKSKAKRDRWRVPERTLLLFAGLGGSIGAFIGMQVFHHKTRKAKFYIGVPLILVTQIVLIVLLFRALS